MTSTTCSPTLALITASEGWFRQWIERLNKSFRRTLKMRNALPNPKAAITLMGYVAMEMEEKTYSYPISNFKLDVNFNLNRI